MRLSNVRKIIHEVARAKFPSFATIKDLLSVLETRYNIAEGLINITEETGLTWEQIFRQMPDFYYSDDKRAYCVVDAIDYLEKSIAYLKRMNLTKDLARLEALLDELDAAKTVTWEEFERRSRVAFNRERDERKDVKMAVRGYPGPLPQKHIQPVIQEEEEPVDE